MAALNPFRDINIHASQSHYTFCSPSSPDAPALVVNRPSGDMRMVQSVPSGGKRVTSIAGILGIIRLRLDKYIIIITKAMLVGRIRGHSVYQIQATEFLPLQERQLHDPDEDNYLSLLRTHLRTGPMYFSYSFDLTNTFQRQSTADLSLPLFRRADDRFFWNRYMQSDLIDMSSHNSDISPYILPVYFGFLTIATTALKSTPMTFILITRKSRHRAGTRYNTRGVDEAGNVANFNETEQIIVLGDETGGLGGYDQNSIARGNKQASPQAQVFSYVQTRGSVPVFWAEVNNLTYTPKLQVRDVDSAVPFARRHFEEQIRLYGDNYLVNLVNQKGREEQVKASYEKVVRALVSSPAESKESSARTSERFRGIESTENRRLEDRIHYIYFDFHHECKGMQLHRTQLILEKLGDELDQNYFHLVGDPVASVVRQQRSVVRTNCMDCLDRTNVVQSMLARVTLNKQMTDAGVLTNGENSATYEHFELMFRNAWADNADVVSRAYSGTGALKTDLTRTGVRTTAGALADLSNSITRYFCNNFTDGPRQDAYDLFLGTYLPATTGISSSLQFVDRRPVFVQGVPYILYAAIFLEFAAFALPRPSNEGLLSIRVFVIFWLLVGLWAATFIKKYGMLYVNWPKLNAPGFAVEGYNEALGKVKKDKLVGKWVGGHERGSSSGGSNIRLIHLEEGKKRIE